MSRCLHCTTPPPHLFGVALSAALIQTVPITSNAAAVTVSASAVSKRPRPASEGVASPEIQFHPFFFLFCLKPSSLHDSYSFYEPCLSVHPGVQRVHHPCDEPAEGAVSNTTHLAQRDRAHGRHHPPQVQLHPDAAETEHLRGCHDPALTLPRRQVCVSPAIFFLF